MDDNFTKQFGISFKESSESSEEKRNTKSKIIKETISKINEDNVSTSVDRLYGARQSLRGWDTDRKKKSFETVPSAKKRTSEENVKISTGVKKPKNHVGNFDSYNIDKHSLETAASSWTNETSVVWKQLGEQFVRGKDNEIKGHFGQVAKEYLKDKEIEGFQFTFKGKDENKPRTRRALKRVYKDLSVPTDISAKKVKLLLSDKIRTGEIEIGENIVEREYKKLITNELGNVVTCTFSVNGRKHPLSNLRVKFFKKHCKFMRLNSDSYFENLQQAELCQRLNFLGELNLDENIHDMKKRLKKYERSRHFVVWHDASVIANHGHILSNIHIMYDPAVFYTSDEYKKLTGYDVNVQREVEAPELYIIGRCKSNDEQLAYIETRVECLEGLKTDFPLNTIDEKYEGIILNDSMRLFKGDGPAVAFEAGNQKGGYYFCPCCDVHACLTDDISHCYQQRIKSIKDIQRKVVKGRFGSKNSLSKQTCPFEKLSSIELLEELKSRDFDLENIKATKKELLPILKKELRGTKRVPVLLFDNPLIELKNLGLSKYEMSMVECMHDIAGHIDNILEELPHHLKLADKQKVNELLQVYYAEKDKKRCCDRRKMLLHLTQCLYQKIDGKVHKLLKTLSEIQRILYLGDHFRTAKIILRLHNCSFEHFVLLKEVLPINNLSDKMSRDRFYGKYQHNLCVHAPLQYRLINGETINCEDEERSFNLIKNITKDTSNYKPGHLIGNLIVRQEVESQCREKYEFDREKDSTLRGIREIGKKVEETQYNSLFTYDYIQKNSADWQAHLQSISDFLIFGENIWWEKTEFGIQFFDVDQPEEIELKPRVHHFRSSNIKSIADELEKNWLSIVNNNICIPTHEILLGNENENVVYRKTTFLSDKIENCPSPDTLSLKVENQLCTNEDFAGEDVTDFILENVAKPDNANFENISTDTCINNSEVSSSSVINLPSCSKTISSNTKDLSSKKANAISIVLGEISPLLQRYDHGLTILKRLQKEKLNASENFKDHLLGMQSTLQQQVSKKVSELRSEFECWERSFLINNGLCAPTQSDFDGDNAITDINRRINIGNNMLSNCDTLLFF